VENKGVEPLTLPPPKVGGRVKPPELIPYEFKPPPNTAGML